LTVFRSLKQRTFLTLWIGQTLSRVGDYVYEIALAWWVLQKTGSAQIMSLVLIFALTPSILFALLGGVAVDRFSRPRLMLTSDVLRGLVALVVALLAWANILEVWHVYLASLLFGFLDAFFQPAYAALVPQLVPEPDLTSANSLTSLSLNLGRVIGPSLGALIFTWLGPYWAFGLNSATFFVSSAFLVPLLFAAIPTPSHSEKTHLWQDLRLGLAAVTSRSWLWITILIVALTNITLAGPYSIAMPFLVSDFMKANVSTLGLIYAIFPLGYVVGSLWLGRYQRIRRRGLVSFLGMALAALMLALFGLHLPLWSLLLAAMVNGIALQADQQAWTSLLQEKIPNEELGRVFSIDSLGSFALLPVGLALAGWATQTFGPSPVFLVGGVLTALIALLALLLPAIRQLD
jgi:DHA3 family tetracycline resistance protein-like MFS transporter